MGYHVRRLCAAAGVSIVSPHGLRGTHATICASVGASPDIVARSLGHTSYAVTAAHYTNADVMADQRQTAVGQVLAVTKLGNSVTASAPGNRQGLN